MIDLMPKHILGVVSPRGDSSLIHYQFYRLVPRDVMLVSANLSLEDYTVEAVDKALADFGRCIDVLAQKKANVIVQAGIPIAALKGRDFTLNLLRQVEEKTSIPGHSNMESVIAGMHHLGVKKIAIGSRWRKYLNDAVESYLAEAGIRVVGRIDYGQTAPEASAMSLARGMEMAVELGRQALRAAPEADGLLLPGGAWISIHAIPILEEEFGKPVFSNLQSMTWQALRRFGTWKPIPGWGRLLGSP